ncbi:MAG: metal ABC transporter substrate-binding protein [Actinomycetota bacterium]
MRTLGSLAGLLSNKSRRRRSFFRGDPGAPGPGLALLMAVPLLLTACGGGESGRATRKPSVVTAVYPLEFVARQVAGNKASVENLTPAGVEPHGLELTSGQQRRVRQADLLVYLGQGFQPAVQELIADRDARSLDAISLAQPALPGDPHVWLDPVLMVAITDALADALGSLDEPNKAVYQRNAGALIEELNDLDDRYQIGLTRCDRRQVVSSHAAFGYLAERYNLEQVGIAGISPDQEPSARRLAEVAGLVKRQGITTIFFESLLPPDLVETVARETSAQTVRLDPIESPPPGGDYLKAMADNLAVLRPALGCR